MNGDPQAFRRAGACAAAGLGVQAFVAAVLGALALWTGTPAAFAMAWAACAGLAPWLVLLLLYQQRRIERLELMDVEKLGTSSAAAADRSIFERTQEDLSAARRRVKALYRWGLPGASLFTGAYLLGMGAWLFRANLGYFDAAASDLPRMGQAGAALAVAGGLAFFAFLVGRYLLGMAEQPEWQLLRGGAGHLMCVVAGTVLLAAGYASAHFESPGVLQYAAVLVPLAMGLVGVEILVWQVLDLYRPRRAGEEPRPAFDSRLLALLGRPEHLGEAFRDAVNYQFGFEITRGWFWALLSRAFVPLLCLGVASLLALSCLVLVEPHQQAALTRFGRLSDAEPLGPGLHLKWPWPFEQAELHDVARIHELHVGSHHELMEETAILWTNTHADAEDLLIVASSGEPSPAAGEDGARGSGAPAVSLLAADIFVQYRIGDLRAYLLNNGDVEHRLAVLAEQHVARLFLGRDINAWLGPERAAAGAQLKGLLEQDSAREKLGVEIVFAGASGVHPPQQVADAFHDTVTAYQEREAAIETARTKAIARVAEVAGSTELAARIVAEIDRRAALESTGASAADLAAQELKIEALLQKAGGAASRMIAEARAARWKRENEERGKALRFDSLLKAHDAAPGLFRMRGYLDAFASGIASARKYILLGARKDLTVRLDLKDIETDFPAVDLTKKE